MKETTQIIKSKEAIQLSSYQYLMHFGIALFPLIFPAVHVFNKLGGVEVVNESSTQFLLGTVVVSILLAYGRWRDLRFYELSVSRTSEEFAQAVLSCEKKLYWVLIKFDDQNVEAITQQTFTQASASSRILIKRKSDKVLFYSDDVFLGFNKRQARTFFNYYLRAGNVQNLEAKVEAEIIKEEYQEDNEAEWNLKNTLKRVVAYLFSFVFIAIGVIIVVAENFHVMCLLFFAIGLAYPLLDIYVLLKKSGKGGKLTEVIDGFLDGKEEKSLWGQNRSSSNKIEQIFFKTERLEIKKLQAKDKPFFLELYTDNRIQESGIDQRVDMFVVLSKFEANLKKRVSPVDFMENLWAVFEKGKPEMIGVVSFLKNEDGQWGMNYQFRYDFINKRYGTELTEGMIIHCFDKLHLNKLTADVGIKDTGSIRVLEKLMIPVEEFRNEEGQRVMRRFEISKRDRR